MQHRRRDEQRRLTTGHVRELTNGTPRLYLPAKIEGRALLDFSHTGATMRATRKTGFDSAPSSIMASLYDQLEALVLAAGVPRPVWDEFTQALKMSGGPITCWLGATTPGEMTLRAWQSETRVDPQTAGELAEALVALLRDEGARCIEDGIGRLLCCRGSESSGGRRWRAVRAAFLWRPRPVSPTSAGTILTWTCPVACLRGRVTTA